ncbi:hypothetical protein Dimus_023886 [Dionaea muscipula]
MAVRVSPLVDVKEDAKVLVETPTGAPPTEKSVRPPRDLKDRTAPLVTDGGAASALSKEIIVGNNGQHRWQEVGGGEKLCIKQVVACDREHQPQSLTLPNRFGGLTDIDTQMDQWGILNSWGARRMLSGKNVGIDNPAPIWYSISADTWKKKGRLLPFDPQICKAHRDEIDRSSTGKLRFKEDVREVPEDELLDYEEQFGEVCFASGACLSDSQRVALEAEFAEVEVNEALWRIGVDKAPGIDGFNAFFFEKTWEITSSMLTKVVLQFFQNESQTQRRSNRSGGDRRVETKSWMKTAAAAAAAAEEYEGDCGLDESWWKESKRRRSETGEDESGTSRD